MDSPIEYHSQQHRRRHSEMHVIQLAQATATVCLRYSAATIWASLAWPGWLVSTLKTLAATEAKASQVSQGGTYKWPDLAEQFQTKGGQI